jgi:hypothetical protein
MIFVQRDDHDWGAFAALGRLAGLGDLADRLKDRVRQIRREVPRRGRESTGSPKSA